MHTQNQRPNAIQEEVLFQAIKELQLEEKVKEQHHDSFERIEAAGVPALDAVSVQSDADDYTPAGTPQSLNPLDGEQMDQILMGKDIAEKPLQSKDEKHFKKEDSKSLTFNDENKNSWKKDESSSSKNNSAQSLHISAYVNSNEGASSDSLNENIDGLIKKQKQIYPASTFLCQFQNPFEYRRQQNDPTSSEPEMSVFRASQRLLYPDATSSNAERNDAETVEARYRRESEALFLPLLDEYVANNKKALVKTREEVQRIAAVLKKAEQDEHLSRAEKNDYKLIKRYAYSENENGVKLSTLKGKKVAVKEDMFDILFKLHDRKGHCGCNIMYNSSTIQKYEGITKPLILLFLKCCRSCELKKASVKKGLVVKPILSEDYNARCQLDLIDLQSKPDGEFKFIFVYQDHLTKYVVLRPLKAKSAAAVAEVLRQVFCDFGPPSLLQTDNGREFANSTIEALVAEFNCKLIHGKPRHSQSQGSVERANRDIQDILTILMQRCNSNEWANLLPEVQLKKNTRHHRGINRSPYKALFGRDSVFTGEFEEAISRNAEEADKVTEYDNQETESLYQIGEDYGEDMAEDSGNDMDEDIINDTDEEIGGDIDELAKSLNNIQRNRSSARKAAKKQADKMQEASNKRFGVLLVGDNVRLPLPDVDRGKTDHRNIMGVIVDIKNGFYIVGTSAGILKSSYARNQLVPVEQRFLNVEDVPQTEARSLRSVANLASTSGGQGHVHCNCTTGCQNKRCKCLSNDRRCNSRCHNSNTCRNKFDD